MYDVIIIGSGPAGYTAALYAGRANLKTLVLEGIERGGQLMITSEVENYPGFPEGIMGPEIMELFRKQAQRFGAELMSQLADEVILNQGSPFRVRSSEKWYEGKTIIAATGASARFLNIPSEKDFKGKGISACATCDGFFFKNKEVLVVGGGDSAMEEATFLTKFASKVTIIHRSDKFRASKIMFQRAEANPKISFRTFSVIDEFYGDIKTGIVARVKIKDTRDESIHDLVTQGVFIAIGHDPNTKIFKNQLDMNEKGYILTKPGRTSTSIPGVFAAGDVQDDYYRQAVTAAGSGCSASIEAERFLESQVSEPQVSESKVF